MRRLILFRHAKAEPRRPGARDADRALRPSGRADARASGVWLTQKGYEPEVVLVSPSLRTRETWDCVENLLPASRRVLEDSLYDALPQEIMALVEAVSGEAETVMVVAHNPGLQDLAIELLGEGGDGESDVIATGFPTATVAVIDMSDLAHPRLEGVFNPRLPPPFVETWDDPHEDLQGEGP